MGTMTTLKEKLGNEGRRDMEDNGRLPYDLISPDAASVICCFFFCLLEADMSDSPPQGQMTEHGPIR